MQSNVDYFNGKRKEVSESIIEYLIGEILVTPVPDSDTDSESNTDTIALRLDSMGYDVGYRSIERLVSKTKFLGSDPLDIMKFICKEFWEEIYKKKIDKLQTNHRGVFVLSDTKFKWLEKYSSDDIKSKQAAARLLNYPCGLLRGALANLGLPTIVNADFNNLPACTFNIRVKS